MRFLGKSVLINFHISVIYISSISKKNGFEIYYPSMISHKMPIFVYHLANTSNYLIVFNRVSRYEPFFSLFFPEYKCDKLYRNLGCLA